MNKRTIIYAAVCFLFGWVLVTTVAGQKSVFDPDVELKIKGLVCSSCAIGVKNGFKKTKLIKAIKFDTKKQITLIEFINIEIHPSEMSKIVKNAGYELTSIKWLKDKKPNRYNAP
tara:strand:+ start:796 stop:1140 length:345 start_codon:yes stop_codon:yes gene_type:complete